MTPRSPSTSAAPMEPSVSEIDGLVQLSFLVQNTLARCSSKHNLSLIQTRLLGVLRDREPSMHELAKLLDLDKSSITGLIDRAEGRGLVKRTPSITDRRTVLITLTREARTLVATVSREFEREITSLLNGLSMPQRQALSRLVSQLLIARAANDGIASSSTTDQKTSTAVRS
jgi:MarR family transcriptional regulator, lower aerobic nicotinate degradation pathway regulator